MEAPITVGGPQGSPTPSLLAQPNPTQTKKEKIGRLDWPDMPPGENAHVPATLENFGHLMEHCGIKLRFNSIKKRVDVKIPDTQVELQNRDQILLTKIESLVIRYRMSPAKVGSYILALGGDKPYDPFAEWITSKPWDGVSRLSEICETLVLADDYSAGFRNALLVKWLLSIVAATFKTKGFRARGVLTLQGGQGIGKTSWFASLIGPPDLCEDIVKLGHSWDGGSKDARLTAIRRRIVELGELEGSFRRDIASLKAFITETTDKIRPPYGRVEAEYQRSTIFGASVNDGQFLLDSAGNSRFWTIALKDIDYSHGIDMQQVFAQLKTELDNGSEWWLTAEEEKALEAVNQSHRVVCGVEATITDRLDMSRVGERGLPKLTANQVLQALEFKNPSNAQSKEANVALRALLGESKRSRGQNRWPIPWSKDPEPTGNEYFQDEDVFEPE